MNYNLCVISVFLIVLMSVDVTSSYDYYEEYEDFEGLCFGDEYWAILWDKAFEVRCVSVTVNFTVIPLTAKTRHTPQLGTKIYVEYYSNIGCY